MDATPISIQTPMSAEMMETDDTVDVKALESEVKAPVVEYKKEALVTRLESMASSNEEGKCLEIRIMPEYMSVNHKPVKKRQLYGDLVYTHDSDLVAVLMHLGYFRMMDTTPIGMVNVKAIIRVMPNQPFYPSRLRNNLLSRQWHCAQAQKKSCAYKVEGCWLVKRDWTLLPLKRNIGGNVDYVPTYVPSHSDRAVATRSTTATAERRQRNLPEQSFMFNLSNEICMKYSIFTVADRGLRPWQWTSARLQKDVMYLETKKERYELSRQEDKMYCSPPDPKDSQEHYQWVKCDQIMNQAQIEASGVPLPRHHTHPLHTDLTWEEIKVISSHLHNHSMHMRSL